MLYIYKFLYWHTLPVVQASGPINNIANAANFGQNSAREIAFHLFDGGDDVNHNGVGLIRDTGIFMRWHHLKEYMSIYKSDGVGYNFYLSQVCD